MEIGPASKNISYKMPATTRNSSYISSLILNSMRPMTVMLPPGGQGKSQLVDVVEGHGRRWTVTEERELIRLCRHTDMKPDEIAERLNRSEEAVRYRLAKIFLEHLDGRTDDEAVQEVSDWLLPN